jgi:MinD-like ATPase involved in chromosome partitioning or flagellar assembly
VAKIKDYADEAGISDSRYAEVKQMYLAALAQIADALKRLVEVDPKLGDMAIDNFQELSTKLVKSLEEIATTYASKMNDSVEHEGEHLNESIFTGYKGRIEKLRKKLVNIISDSKGKDTKSGYGRDWQRMFTALDQKLDAIDTAKDVIGEKDRKNLADLEKQTDNLAQEYYNYKIKATEQVMKKIVDDDELVTKFSDVNELITAALDMIAKANVQEAIIETRIREELEETFLALAKLRVDVFIPEDRENLDKAMLNGLPLALLKRSSPARIAIAELAKQLLVGSSSRRSVAKL